MEVQVVSVRTAGQRILHGTHSPGGAAVVDRTPRIGRPRSHGARPPPTSGLYIGGYCRTGLRSQRPSSYRGSIRRSRRGRRSRHPVPFSRSLSLFEPQCLFPNDSTPFPSSVKGISLAQSPSRTPFPLPVRLISSITIQLHRLACLCLASTDVAAAASACLPASVALGRLTPSVSRQGPLRFLDSEGSFCHKASDPRQQRRSRRPTSSSPAAPARVGEDHFEEAIEREIRRWWCRHCFARRVNSRRGGQLAAVSTGRPSVARS